MFKSDIQEYFITKEIDINNMTFAGIEQSQKWSDQDPHCFPLYL